jgi:hypothetical protein
MSFGRPSLSIYEPRKASAAASAKVRRIMARRLVVVRGRWWLWIFLARWELTLSSKDVIRWTSTRREMTEGLRELDGQRLTGVQVDPADGRTRFSFDLGAGLNVWRLTRKRSDDDSDLWTMYLPDGHVIIVKGHGAIVYEPGSK